MPESALTGPTSNSAEPVTTSASSPDTLPLKGYSIDQLANYIMRQLGFPTWQVELTKQQILDNIQDALAMFSQWVPLRKAHSIGLIRDRFAYLQGVDVGQGIADVSFVEPNPVPTEIFYGNLNQPAPLFRLGLDEYDVFLRWRKTWMRVTSVRPDWYYDDGTQSLFIHNPIERYQAGIITFWNYDVTQQLNNTGAQWVKKYALAKSAHLLGDIWMKYSGAIPAPAQNLQLDTGRRDQAQVQMDKLEIELKGLQTAAGCFID